VEPGRDPRSSTLGSKGRAEVAYYLASDAPKLWYLAKILQDEGVLQGPYGKDGKRPGRMLVFCRYPLVMWLVEMFLDALGVPFTTIKSSMNMEQRTAAYGYFNDPNSDCAILLTTYIRAAYGLNLQAACCLGL
jgi:superfamily II DNA/RNA helicase